MPRTRRKSVYYAHAICLYGYFQERDQLNVIRRAFPDCRVVNPARYQDDPGKLADTMGFCFRLIEQCDALVFTGLFGKITTGVGKEVNHALRLGKPVYELKELDREWEFARVREPVKFISRRATLALYRRFRD